MTLANQPIKTVLWKFLLIILFASIIYASQEDHADIS